MKTPEGNAITRSAKEAVAPDTGKTPHQQPSPQKLEALADVFELLSLSFSFPTQELAHALASGVFQSDLADCLKELDIATMLPASFDEDPEQLYDAMKKEYSRLYHSPGKLAVIYPYESAFLFVEGGNEGSPTLIANRLTADVERCMAAAGALPETARREPVDSVFGELGFLRHLYTQALANTLLNTKDGDKQAEQWLDAAEEFRSKHIDTWLPAFMDKTTELSRLTVYRDLAQLSKHILCCTTV